MWNHLRLGWKWLWLSTNYVALSIYQAEQWNVPPLHDRGDIIGLCIDFLWQVFCCCFFFGWCAARCAKNKRCALTSLNEEHRWWSTLKSSPKDANLHLLQLTTQIDSKPNIMSLFSWRTTAFRELLLLRTWNQRIGTISSWTTALDDDCSLKMVVNKFEDQWVHICWHVLL